GLGSIASSRDPVAAALAHLIDGKPIERARDAIQTTPTETDEQMRALDADELRTNRALKILRIATSDAYAQARAALPKATQAGWEDELACEPDDFDLDAAPATADAAGLLRFLDQAVLPSYTQRWTELKHRSLIRAQALGEAFNPVRLEPLSRYEVHLDRKLERTLTMLIRLRELRHTASLE
ncbi:MAG TPA: hypothetical protein VKB96_08370, partial [Gammaproteobacteria bacterium]|nr:hypothetical protein [Gammaproteobacteria bacterium]